MQLAAFAVSEKLPAAHAVHVRSAMDVPLLETYVPAVHVVWGLQLAAFAVSENVPAAHTVHLRSSLDVPILETYVPAVHVV